MNKILACAILSLGILTAARAQEAAVSTNVADYADLGTMNMGMSYALARHWTVDAVVKYNPFSYRMPDEAVVQRKQRLFGAGARFWPWHVYSGWWLSGRAQWQEFSQSLLRESIATEGDRVGAALAAGYSYMLSKHFNLEVGAGVWAGYTAYTQYACPRCGRIIGRGREGFILPSDVILALSYIF